MYNYTIGRVWGIPIRINISMLVVLPVFAWLIGSGAQIELYAAIFNPLAPVAIDPATLMLGDRPWIIGAAAAIGLFASVAVHELGHSWVALRYGIGVESITLWILGGLASLESMPREWNREFWIAIAGPITSVLLGVVSLGALQVIPPESAPVAFFFVGWLGVMNLFLAGFNLLPAFPMDGGRILRALLARNRSYASATRIAARSGTTFAILFAILGVFGGAPMLLLLALFVYVAASGESRAVVLSELLDGLTVGDLAAREEAVPAEATVGELMDRLLGARRTDIAIAGPDGAIEGVVTAGALRSIDPAAYEDTTARSLAETDLPRFDATMGAFEALGELDRARANVAIVERDGRAEGFVSRSDFAAVMEFQREKGPF